MRCPACGHDNLAGEETCDNCGASLRPAEERSTLPQPDPILTEPIGLTARPDPPTIDGGTPVATAIQRMRDEAIDALLVVSGGRLVGIFTDRDGVLRAAGRPIEAFDVRDLMTPDPVVLSSFDPLALAIHRMADGGYRHLPIVDDGVPVGIVSAADVFRRVLSLAG